MLKRSLVIFVLILIQANLFAQNNQKSVPSPAVNEFAPMLYFLSSDWMEGREAGTKGSFMAADYVSSMMQLFGLQPFGDKLESGEKLNRQQGYFQDFQILQYKTEKSGLAIITKSGQGQSTLNLIAGVDFEVQGGPNGLEAESPLVFAGYGFTAVDKGYDDYKALDVKGKIVVVLNGFPGHADSTSVAWKKFGKSIGEEGSSVETKLRNAKLHGAIALFVIDADGKYEPFARKQINRTLLSSTMNSAKGGEDDYESYYHILPNDTANQMIPYFRLGSSATRQMISGTGLNLTDFEKKTARLATPSSMLLKDKFVRISVKVKAESLLVRNVLGMIPGKDTTRFIVLGGHYDHLGTHNGHIYNGSDDNASGASGLLALAKVWKESGMKPACNLIFASWSAEEEGLLGSQHFADNMSIAPKNVLLYINMDMISRSETSDSTQRKLSIGTRTADENLRELARKTNSTLDHPFNLDLWDVTGHSGSDYASFTAKNIPVMTYNTGLHDDYHTPRDISALSDLVKMGDVLRVVNESLHVFMERLVKK